MRLERLPCRVIASNAIDVIAVLRFQGHVRKHIMHNVKNMQALESSVRRLLESALVRAPEAFVFFL